MADSIPAALRSLLSAPSAEEVGEAYWRLENHVVVQGQLFEAAVATTRVLMAALAASNRPRFVRIGTLDLLFQIVSGEADESEAARGLSNLGDMCRSAAREGLWVLYRELLEGETEAAREVIELLDPDPRRLRELERRAANSGKKLEITVRGAAQMSSWKSVNLCGAADIERVCGVYEIAEHTKVPGGRFQIKVLERMEGGYIAVPNVCLKAPDGTPDGRAGLGDTELEALQNALMQLMEDLGEKAEVGPDDFHWTSPETF